MENLPHKNCLVYCRVSTTKQAQQGESIEDQAKICLGVAERKNLKVLNVFKEQYSGRKNERPVIEDIITFIKKSNKKIDYLIFRAIDRFTRNGTLGYETLKQLLAKYGVELIDANGVIQPSKNTLEHLGMEYDWSRIYPSEISELVMAQQGKNEVNVILTRMIGSEINLVREGYKVRQADDGYINQKVFVENKKRVIQVPDPERAHYFAKMFELRASGAFSDIQIVGKLNAMGYRSRDRKHWSKDKSKVIGSRGRLKLTVKKLQSIIKRPIYCGINIEKWVLEPTRTQYKGLVSIKKFNDANRGQIYIDEQKNGSIKILKDFNPLQLKRTRNNPLFHFKDVILCPHCDKPFLGSSPKGKIKKYPTYHCCRNHKYYGVSKDTFEKNLSEFVKKITYSDENYFRSLEATIKNKYREKEKELGEFASQTGTTVIELKTEKKRLIDAFTGTTNTIIREDLEEKIEEIQKQILSTEGERNKLEIKENDIHAFVGYVKKIMEHPEEYLIKQKDFTKLRSLYGLVFDKLPTYEEIVNGTPKLSLPYKLSNEFDTNKSRFVDLGFDFWNKFARECEYLTFILREYEADKQIN